MDNFKAILHTIPNMQEVVALQLLPPSFGVEHLVLISDLLDVLGVGVVGLLNLVYDKTGHGTEYPPNQILQLENLGLHVFAKSPQPLLFAGKLPEQHQVLLEFCLGLIVIGPHFLHTELLGGLEVLLVELLPLHHELVDGVVHEDLGDGGLQIARQEDFLVGGDGWLDDGWLGRLGVGGLVLGLRDHLRKLIIAAPTPNYY